MYRMLRRATAPVLIASLFVVSLAWAFHAALVKAVPAIECRVAVPPTDLTLWFNERPDLALSNIRLIGPDSVPVLVGAPRAASDSMALTTSIRGVLTPGKYTVRFRTAGPDGHVMQGKYSFTYQP